MIAWVGYSFKFCLSTMNYHFLLIDLVVTYVYIIAYQPTVSA